MLALYAEGMTVMGQNPHLPQLFRDIFKNAYLPYRDPETLRLFLNSINEFKYDHSEKLGDAFEYLLSVLGSQGDAGQFRTPRHIIDFIVKIIDPKKNETILDPACGTSGFLISSYKHILNTNTNQRLGDGLTPDEKVRLTNNLNGYDISPDMVRLSLVNLFLHGFTNPKVYEYDSLSSQDRWNEYYDVVLANPPFMTPTGGIRPHRRFGISSNRAEVLFVDYIMEHLTPKGRAGIVVPEGIIFQSGKAYKSLRRMMVEKYLVGVISLPSGVFNPYSGVKTSILVLDRELSQKTDSIFFAKVEKDGYDLGAQRREIEKNDLPIFLEEISNYLNGLRNGKEVDTERLNFVPKEKILASNDVGLSYDRYTEKGLINSSFPMFELKEVVDFRRGTSITKKDVIDGDIPVIAGGQKPAYYHNKYNRIGETITVSSSGAYSGFVNYFNTAIFASDCFTISPKDENSLLPKFLFQLLKSKQSEIYSRQVGGGQPHIYPKSFDGFEIPLPPIEVQEEIVRELEQYQKIIDGANQVVDNYKPVIDIDPSWEMKELGEVCDFKRGPFGGSLKKEIFVKDGYLVYEQYHAINDDPNFGRYFITPEKYSEMKSFSVCENDLLISCSGTMGKITRIKKDFKEGIINQALLRLRLMNSDNDVSFVKLYLESNAIQEKYFRDQYGAAIQNVMSVKDLKKIPFPELSLDIQQSIVDRIESERQIIEGNKKLIEIYTQKIQDRINKIWGN
jgi:type I restriction enzyme M protein